MSKPGSSATDMRKRALEVPAFGALAAFWHVGVLPADREFVSRFRDALLLPVDHRGKRKEGPGVVGPLRAPYLSTTTKRLTPKLIDDDETVDAERAPGKGIRRRPPGCCGLIRAGMHGS